MNEWEKFFAWFPVRMGRHLVWLRTLERSKAYFVPLTDDNHVPPPCWVYRYYRKP